MRTADAIVRLLIANDVQVVFGVSGDTSMIFHDAFDTFKDEIQYIACRDERHAAYMADTYSRSSGKPGVVDVPSGGGVLYAVPGISEANASSIPLICFSSDIPLSSEETGALTELKQEELMKPITKWNSRVKQPGKVPHLIRKAFRMATGGRPGAVHLSVPECIHEMDHPFDESDFKALPQSTVHNGFSGGVDEQAVKEAADTLSKAKKPFILAGGGVHLAQAYDELTGLSTAFGIPVGTTINGKGAIAETAPNAIGVIGVNGGCDETNRIAMASDVILVLGSKLNNVTTVAKKLFSQGPTVIQVDISEEMLDLNIRTDQAIQANIQPFLKALNQKLAGKEKQFKSQLTSWHQETEALMDEKRARIREEVKQSSKYVNPARIVDYLNTNAPEDSLFVMDAGTQNPYMAANFLTRYAGRSTIFDRGHGNLGYALSASIGAQMAHRDKRVFSLFGDGSFAMSAGELETAARLNLPIVFILFQNNSYGWIKKLQQLYYGERYIGVDFNAINGAMIAEGFGVESRIVKDPKEMEAALDWAIKLNKPVFLDMHIDPITSITPPVTNWREDSKVDPSEREALTY